MLSLTSPSGLKKLISLALSLFPTIALAVEFLPGEPYSPSGPRGPCPRSRIVLLTISSSKA